MIRNLLILDSPEGGLLALNQAFRQALGAKCVVHTVSTLAELRASLRSELSCDLVVVDFQPRDGACGGAEVLSELRALDHDLPIVAVSNRGGVDSARQAIAAGASDFLVQGENLEARVATLVGKIQGLVTLIQSKRTLEEQNLRLSDAAQERYQILGDSLQMRALMDRLRRVARVPRPVLITGERGTGKELAARAIHGASGTPGRSIVAVNCAAFPDALLESELFGHERGAFTGADRRMQGKFELADDGTLFLDEIGFMSVAFQQKILRAVEYGVFTRVGGNEEIATSARIIAATNVDLMQRMEQGEFLRDLYDRLAFEVIEVPPLRQREGDVELLAREFLLRFMREIPAFRGKQLSRQAIDALNHYAFPGNVRELKNIIERAAYRDTTNEITPEDIGLLSHSQLPSLIAGNFDERLEALKRGLVLKALEEAGGNQAEAARRLGLSYHKFRYYHRRYAS